MLIEVMATHKVLAKNLFEYNLKEKGNIVFVNRFDSGSKCDE